MWTADGFGKYVSNELEPVWNYDIDRLEIGIETELPGKPDIELRVEENGMKGSSVWSSMSFFTLYRVCIFHECSRKQDIESGLYEEFIDLILSGFKAPW